MTRAARFIPPESEADPKAFPAGGDTGSARKTRKRKKDQNPTRFSATGLPPRRRRWYSTAALTAYALALALAIGFGSAWWMLRGPYPFGQERAGTWTYWPDVGSADTDPYMLAMINRSARLPLGVGEGLELATGHDTAGANLRSNCSYRLGPTVPQARFWTLTAFDAGGGRPIRTHLGRSGFTSSEIVREEDGSFSILLSRRAQPGNWLQLPEGRNFILVLRLYDTPATAGRTLIDPAQAPKVERLGCDR